ncbi:hypothetical protein EVAR_50039_1 [Eumeta japonica]|uniref:Uncharacterized protein n=1 Tax=Eumeta variegata TaxID=151549 RepID=A0A4C1XIS9_EUMVA|nr:hypothetical protein EVAR_50039_1 [Eumeta japonica]
MVWLVVAGKQNHSTPSNMVELDDGHLSVNPVSRRSVHDLDHRVIARFGRDRGLKSGTFRLKVTLLATRPRKSHDRQFPDSNTGDNPIRSPGGRRPCSPAPRTRAAGRALGLAPYETSSGYVRNDR